MKDLNDVGTLGVFVFALVLIAVLISRMDGETIAFLSASMFLFFMCSKQFHSSSKSEDEADGMEDPGDSPAAAAPEPNIMAKQSGDPAVWASIDADQRPAEPEWGAPNPATRELIKKSNALAVSGVFGRRYGGTMDNALYKHKQRIGDRDRQATINQVRARRNNVYEPYYRQELAEAERSRGWWKDNDDILTTKLDHHQLATIDMGRFNNADSDLDGIYST